MKQKLNCILLVDDDDATNYMSSHVIQKAGVTNHIEIKLNGKEAIDYLISKQNDTSSYELLPDLIFLDINMPLMDGWEFLEAYKDLNANNKKAIIVVMLTTSLNPDDKFRASQISEIAEFKNKQLTVGVIEELMQKYFVEYL